MIFPPDDILEEIEIENKTSKSTEIVSNPEDEIICLEQELPPPILVNAGDNEIVSDDHVEFDNHIENEPHEVISLYLKLLRHMKKHS